MIFQTLKPRDKFESTGVGLALVKRSSKTKAGTSNCSHRRAGSYIPFTGPKKTERLNMKNQRRSVCCSSKTMKWMSSGPARV